MPAGTPQRCARICADECGFIRRSILARWYRDSDHSLVWNQGAISDCRRSDLERTQVRGSSPTYLPQPSPCSGRNRNVHRRRAAAARCCAAGPQSVVAYVGNRSLCAKRLTRLSTRTPESPRYRPLSPARLSPSPAGRRTTAGSESAMGWSVDAAASARRGRREKSCGEATATFSQCPVRSRGCQRGTLTFSENARQ